MTVDYLIVGSDLSSLVFGALMANAGKKVTILESQEHHTPLYTVESFHYRDEVVETNGENNTYHVGAYLEDGLHEGAITSALRVAQVIG